MGTRPHEGADDLEARIAFLERELQTRDEQLRALAETRLALEKSEDKFAKLFRHAPVLIAVTDLATGVYLDVNGESLRVSGYTREEVLGRTATELGWITTAERARLIDELERHGRLGGVELPFRTKSGELLKGLVNGELIVIDGRPCLLTITTDITERRRAVDELRKKTAVLEAQLDSTSEGVLIVDAAGKKVLQNAQAKRLWKIPDDIAENPDDAVQVRHVMSQTKDPAAFARTVAWLYEHRNETTHDEIELTDGTVLARYSAPVFGSDGQHYGRIWTFRDITQSRRAEDALRESEYFFRESQRAAFIGSYRFDFVTDTWTASSVLDDVFGVAPGYPRTLATWVDLIHPDDRASMQAYVAEEVVARGQAFDREYRIVRQRDGEVRWVSGRGQLVRDAQGGLLALIGTIQDITDRKRAEADRAQLEAQLRQAQKMESVGRLAGGVAHDFNNMLSIILSNAELALENVGASEALRQDLEEIRTAAQRSSELTRQLLAFARKQTASPVVLDIDHMVGGMLKMIQRLIGENIALRWRPHARPDGGPTLVRIDPAQLDQILANLCVNARDAIADIGHVTIETGVATFDAAHCARHAGFLPGEFAWLRVGDDGCGMDEDTLAHLFEPFFTTKALGRGTGLGLATVYGIVNQNQGFTHVTSRPGHGTELTVYLPLHRGSPTIAAAPDPRPLGRGQETILLVEDEPAILRTTRRILERQGYHVLAAEAPSEALRVAREHQGALHLLLTDVVMPEMNGRDLAQKVLSLHPSIARLFMSGFTADHIAHHGVLDDGVDFMVKPFSAETLTTTVRRVLDAKR